MHENDSYTKLITSLESIYGKNLTKLLSKAPIEDKINLACNVIGLSLEATIPEVSIYRINCLVWACPKRY